MADQRTSSGGSVTTSTKGMWGKNLPHGGEQEVSGTSNTPSCPGCGSKAAVVWRGQERLDNGPVKDVWRCSNDGRKFTTPAR